MWPSEVKFQTLNYRSSNKACRIPNFSCIGSNDNATRLLLVLGGRPEREKNVLRFALNEKADEYTYIMLSGGQPGGSILHILNGDPGLTYSMDEYRHWWNKRRHTLTDAECESLTNYVRRCKEHGSLFQYHTAAKDTVENFTTMLPEVANYMESNKRIQKLLIYTDLNHMKRAKVILDILQPPFQYEFVDIYENGAFVIVDVGQLAVSKKEWLRIALSSARAASPTFAALYEKAWKLKFSRNKDDPMFPHETRM